MKVKKGDKIKVEYEGTFDDGIVFDSSKNHNNLLEFEVGSSKVIKGFDECVIGMSKDEEKEIKLKPSEAYGEKNSQLVQKVPRNELPDGELKPEMMLIVNLPNGQQMPVIILDVNDEFATLDFNHPLAGKNLNFKIKVVKIN